MCKLNLGFRGRKVELKIVKMCMLAKGSEGALKKSLKSCADICLDYSIWLWESAPLQLQ